MNDLAARLAELSEACWQRGRALPRLAMRKLFEKDGEAYAEWNHSLPGYEAPHADIAQPFASADDLRRLKAAAEAKRDELHREMVALQEEMDWLVYTAYGLVSEGEGLVETLAPGAPLPAPHDKGQRAFVLWAQTEGDFDRAVALIPADWTAERKALWRKRLAAIRDNEHVRRIEQPVYKRRWYQPKSYDEQFVEAFERWMCEKAEWWLEHQHAGEPVELAVWTQALWQDARVQAAWPVAAEVYSRVEGERRQKLAAKKGKKGAAQPEFAGFAPTPDEFRRCFKAIVDAETVDAGWPAAVSYEELAELARKRKQKVPGCIRPIRGKLNVPRERFRRHDKKGPYEWAGKDLFGDRSK
ncbi:MAG: hypothetical protein FJ291_14910 [Planctomycetes bacterium]|nr:hypothetical protein [Planctomycetota bacterium]